MSNKNQGKGGNEKKKDESKPEFKKSGILKNSNEKGQSSNVEPKKSLKWDEMNVMATLHPADKDYGHMKIEEAPTPYEKARPEDGKGVDPETLAASLRAARIQKWRSSNLSTEDDESDEESEERRRKKEFFAKKRKEHYSEFIEAKKRLGRMPPDEDSSGDDIGENYGKIENKPEHPGDKGYGLMKIDEAPTPREMEWSKDGKGVDPETLAASLRAASIQDWRYSNFSSDDDDSDVKPEKRRKKKNFFAEKRKEHSEFQEEKKRLGLLSPDEYSGGENSGVTNNNKPRDNKKTQKNNTKNK